MSATAIDQIADILGPRGLLSRTLKGFEYRPQQEGMSRQVLEAFEEGKIALVEAGTGTGKTLAYLLPALLEAIQSQKRTVISTHTINLQQQLLLKDLPFLMKVMGLDVQVALVKGMHHYVCLRRLEETLPERPLMSPSRAEALQVVNDWAWETDEGSRSALKTSIPGDVWDKVAVESGACSGRRCPHHKRCCFIRDRQEALDAQILIVNHHLLFADLQLKAELDEGEEGILPDYDYLVLDEAHHLEEVATDAFALRLSRFGVVRLLNQLVSDHGKLATGKLTQLCQKLDTLVEPTDRSARFTALRLRIDLELVAERHRVATESNAFFLLVSEYLERLGSQGDDGFGAKVRLLPEHFQHADWVSEILPAAMSLASALEVYSQAIGAVDAELRQLDNERLAEKTQGVRQDLLVIASKLMSFAQNLRTFCDPKVEDQEVKWIESSTSRGNLQVQLIGARLDIAHLLADKLYPAAEGIALVSATLTAHKSFDFTRKRLGLTSEDLEYRKVTESVFESPFRYQEQALFVVPSDLVNPADPRFFSQSLHCIEQLLRASKGDAFVLFTSYQMLRKAAASLGPTLEEEGYPLLCQGDEDRQSLLERFKETKGSVLFGTDSFWEGVDVVGDALRLVIMVKLPFRVPTEPIIQARIEQVQHAGGNPFMDYSVPQAIQRFLQGFGRLVRNHNDRGCVACLDGRLIHKAYGALFLSSLPPCRQVIVPTDEMIRQVGNFLKN